MTAEHPEEYGTQSRGVQLSFENGQPTDAETITQTCTHCGGAVAPAYRYCPWCGREHDD